MVPTFRIFEQFDRAARNQTCETYRSMELQIKILKLLFQTYSCRPPTSMTDEDVLIPHLPSLQTPSSLVLQVRTLPHFPKTRYLEVTKRTPNSVPTDFANFGRRYFHFQLAPSNKLGCYGLGMASASAVPSGTLFMECRKI